MKMLASMPVVPHKLGKRRDMCMFHEDLPPFSNPTVNFPCVRRLPRVFPAMHSRSCNTTQVAVTS